MELVDRALKGDRLSLARLISLVENRAPGAREALELLYPRTGRAWVVGITGAPGTGKSTLVAALTQEVRRQDLSVGIVAVDPTSPFSGGAILGDRVRMQELARDPKVFVRSMASRGALGGLALATAQVVAVLDAMGKDVIFVETVGVGQDEVEIARAAYTIVLVGVPGLGDEIQAIKAGLLEIGDIYVVNKADREGADRLAGELSFMLSMVESDGWSRPVIKTVATEGIGVRELWEAIEQHRIYLSRSGRIETERRRRAHHEILALAREELRRRLESVGARDGYLEELAHRVACRQLDPYRAADELLNALLDHPV